MPKHPEEAVFGLAGGKTSNRALAVPLLLETPAPQGRGVVLVCSACGGWFDWQAWGSTPPSCTVRALLPPLLWVAVGVSSASSAWPEPARFFRFSQGAADDAVAGPYSPPTVSETDWYKGVSTEAWGQEALRATQNELIMYTTFCASFAGWCCLKMFGSVSSSCAHLFCERNVCLHAILGRCVHTVKASGKLRSRCVGRMLGRMASVD